MFKKSRHLLRRASPRLRPHWSRRFAAPLAAAVVLSGEMAIGGAQQIAAAADESSSSNSLGAAGGAVDPAASLPQAPQAQTSDGARAPQTKRILGIIPNFRAVSTDQQLPPQSVKEKFITTTQDSFDYSALLIPAVLAGASLQANTYPEFGSGGLGYGRYLWHSLVDQTSENYWVEFIVPVLAHQDTRFYTLGRGSTLKRLGYAASRVVITRSDAGKEVFNVSEVLGSGAAAGLSNAYYPSRERSFGNTATQWGTNLGVDAFAFGFREFWPDINRKLFGGESDAPASSAK